MSSPRTNRGSRRPLAGGSSNNSSNNTPPPPLLLMNPGKGLTMDAVLGDNVPLLVPTASNETISSGGGAIHAAPPVADVDLNNCEVEDLQADTSNGGFLGGSASFPALKPPSAIPSFAASSFFGIPSSGRDSSPFVSGSNTPPRPSSAQSNASTSSNSGLRGVGLPPAPPPSAMNAPTPSTNPSLPPPPTAIPKSLSSMQSQQQPTNPFSLGKPPMAALNNAQNCAPASQPPSNLMSPFPPPLSTSTQPQQPSLPSMVPILAAPSVPSSAGVPPPPPSSAASVAASSQPPPPPFNATPQSANEVVLKNYDPPPNVAPPPKAAAATSFRLGQGTLGQRVHHGGLDSGAGGVPSPSSSPAQFFPPALVPFPTSQSVHADLASSSSNLAAAVPGAFSMPSTPMAPAAAPPSGGYAPPEMGQPPMNASSAFPAVATSGPTTPAQSYVPVAHHWFYCKQIESKKLWQPFTWVDSMGLEEAFNEVAAEEEDEDLGPLIVSTDGNRHDVNMETRLRESVYWEEPAAEVRRCSWFYKGDADNRFVPYEEDFAEELEEHFRQAMTTGVWHQRLEFPGGEIIVMHSPHAMVHFMPNSEPDEWGTVQEGQSRPRVVKRGLDDTFLDAIEDGESEEVDHLLFVCHGIGPVCDLRFRSIYECVDGMRGIHEGLLDTHFKTHRESGGIGRLEFLPISWHEALHGDASGVDAALKQITLGSIGRLRNFTNSTLLDILFYTSPKYCQQIAETVVGEINRLYALFLERNPTFKGEVSLIGHSLGSLILFDILQHQRPEEGEEEAELEEDQGVTVDGPPGEALDESKEEVEEEEAAEPAEELSDVLAKLGISEVLPQLEAEQMDLETLMICGESDLKELGIPMGPRKKLISYASEKLLEERRKEKEKEAAAAAEAEKEVVDSHPPTRQASSVSISVSYEVGLAGTGQPFVKYPKLDFVPVGCFALGSPIGMFLTVRGLTHIGPDFKLPNCSNFFNIFHPFDPVAYRVEPLIHPHVTLRPVVIPHHKGRKRLHLELKDSLASLGTNIKAQLMESFKSTWSTISEFAKSHLTSSAIEGAVEKAVEEVSSGNDGIGGGGGSQYVMSEISSTQTEDDVDMGGINGGRRVDYVLQEAPFESLNEYMFAFASHLCYWESEDTVLFMCKEIYSWSGVVPVKPASPIKSGSKELSPPSFPTAPMNTTSAALPPPPPMMQSAPPPMMQPPPMMAPPQQPQGGLPFATSSHASGGAFYPPKPMAPPPVSVGMPPVGAQTVAVGPPPISGFFRK